MYNHIGSPSCVSKKDNKQATKQKCMPREQGESGEFVETIAPEDVLEVFDTVDGPVIFSADVADHFGVTRETARRKLKQLSNQGELDRRKVSRRVIYWRAEEDESVDNELQDNASTTLEDTDTEDVTTRDIDGSDRIDRGEWHGRLAKEVAGSGDLADRRADAILKMYDHLRENRSAKKDQLLDCVDPEIVEYANSSSVWSNMVKGEDTLRALPGVKKPASGRNKPWQWDP